jgi:hypothetical protein
MREGLACYLVILVKRAENFQKFSALWRFMKLS